jgi:hypothetical protein
MSAESNSGGLADKIGEWGDLLGGLGSQGMNIFGQYRQAQAQGEDLERERLRLQQKQAEAAAQRQRTILYAALGIGGAILLVGLIFVFKK